MDTYIPKTFKGQELTIREIQLFGLGFEAGVNECSKRFEKTVKAVFKK